MYNIIFNNKHSSNDMGLMRIDSAEHKTPNKIKSKVSIPFMNGSYDFSNLYGGACYSERELEYKFFVEVDNEQLMNYRKIDIENWLMGTNEKIKLIDEDLKGFYYMAECIDIDFENYFIFGIIKATFEAYPFKISSEYEGNNLWDSFNFELDCLQDSSFTINGSNTVNLYNRSAANITPTIHCSSNMEIVKDGVIYKLNAGTSKDYRLELNMGNNKMTIKGNGTIEFKFRAEVL